jgi:two-component system sensor histidine kinase PilS (NtrC family)
VSATVPPASLPRAAPSAPAAAAPEGGVPESFWISLRYFNVYRLAVAAIFLIGVAVGGHDLSLGSRDPALFAGVALAYLVLAIAFHVSLARARGDFNAQLTVHVLTDVVAITILMHASGGFRSGLAGMLLVSLAGAALVSRGSLMLLYAAMASIAILIEQAVWVLADDAPATAFIQPGLLAIAYFATAIMTSHLAQRVITNERIARRRGIDLANQLRINQLVIHDVEDGVLVVDPNGLVRQFNPAVERLLGRPAPELAQVDAYSPELGAALAAWRERSGPRVVSFNLPESGKLVRARFVEAGVEGDRFTLVYLDDQSKLEEQSRQLKLAALGRLTANIAHEIRNPLAAISHAAELLAEENRQPGRDRLNRIIRDNAKRLDRMVKDVLELNRRDRVQAEPVRLAAFLGTFVDDLVQNEGYRREAFVLQADEDAVVDFDRVHLNQILWNLARNAWRHSRQAPGSVRVTLARAGTRLELRIADDGPGVPEELRGQLFEPFFTTFSSGTGLGLYIARELCAANGATLDYTGRGEGAEFSIVMQGVRG